MSDFMKLINGVWTSVTALVTSAGATDAGKVVKLDASGRLDGSLMPAGLTVETRTVQASEALAAGDLVNFHDVGGPRIRKADATTAGKEAQGFVLTAIASGASGAVYPEEATVTGLSGMTPGNRQYLSTTAGQRTAVPPATTGNVVQAVGVALSPTEMLFRPAPPVTLA